MAVEGRKERLRSILRETLEEHLPAETGGVAGRGDRRRMPGPWGRFFADNAAWDSGSRLNRELYLELKGLFDDNVVREVLLAAADVKISRTFLSEEKIGLLGAAAERHAFRIVSGGRWMLEADRGKGGWANGRPRQAAPGEAGAVSSVYIASDTTLAETGRMLEEAGEDDLFGALLGIPACCRASFDQWKDLAAERQGDFVPYVLANTGGDRPYDWRLNYLSQHFGGALLSFFPCSFRCEAAAEVAANTLEMLTECDAAWAKKFVELQQTNVLYTEDAGLHLFRDPIYGATLAYEAGNVRSSEETGVAKLLRQGDRLEVLGKNAAEVYRGAVKIGTVAGEDVCMCCFH